MYRDTRPQRTSAAVPTGSGLPAEAVLTSMEAGKSKVRELADPCLLRAGPWFLDGCLLAVGTNESIGVTFRKMSGSEAAASPRKASPVGLRLTLEFTLQKTV